MSQFDSSHPSHGDSSYTTRVKAILTRIITDLFSKKGFKTWIREEVPLYAIDEPKPYHLDLGVLTRNRESFDQYSFFGVEIDYKTHETFSSDNKDTGKDNAFRRIGVQIFRIRVEKVIGNKKWDLPTIENVIWDFFMDDYNWSPMQANKNQELAIKLKENALARCRNKKCGHPAQKHNLAGCNYQQPNKAALYCPCTEAHFVSDA